MSLIDIGRTCDFERVFAPQHFGLRINLQDRSSAHHQQWLLESQSRSSLREEAHAEVYELSKYQSALFVIAYRRFAKVLARLPTSLLSALCTLTTVSRPLPPSLDVPCTHWNTRGGQRSQSRKSWELERLSAYWDAL